MSLRPVTVLLGACGSPGTAALVHALRENGERELRLVGTDMSERAVGRHLCDAFHLVPPGADDGFADAVLELARREEVDVVLPQSSSDLEALAARRDDFATARVLVSGPETSARRTTRRTATRSSTGSACPAPRFERVRGGRKSRRRRSELGYPDRPVCFKPVVSSGSRGFRVLDPTVDRAHQLLYERPGAVSMRLEEAVELLPAEGGARPARDGARGGRRAHDRRRRRRARASCSGTRRRASRCEPGLAMYFVTLDDPGLMELADRIVSGFAIEHFFNIQLVGDLVIEINPRISTVVYQEDLNLPYLGIKRALGEISDEELASLAGRVRPGRTALRYFDQLEWDRDAPRRPLPREHRGGAVDERPGAPPARGRRPARRLQPLPAAPGGRRVARAAAAASLRRQLTQWSALARLAPTHRRLPLLLRADARAALRPVPAPARAPQEVGDALPRLRHPWQGPVRARVRQEGGRGGRRLVRRDPLGAGGGDDPARDRRARDRAVAAHGPCSRRRSCTRPRPGAARAPSTSSPPARASTPNSSSSRASRTTRRSSATGTRTSSSTS